MPLYTLGFRGWVVNGVECILPPLCPVPGGIFTMGSDKSRDKEASDDEIPQYPIQVDPFLIGQHPVTVAEYACAVRAKAVPEPPKGILGVDWPTQLQRLEHPVVCVTWRDAVAYARWLAERTGPPWRLPTEAEWEKAARGTDGRIYPWGNTFDKVRCNTGVSGIKTTTAVGRYPNGASPYGAQDMAGNVWEWTSSLFKPYPYWAGDGREWAASTENRALRGGSWSYYAGDARAACRDNLRPGDFLDYDGFRLACVAAGS
jgi:formylglycine-generating enzyme required for sulfatase activity